MVEEMAEAAGVPTSGAILDAKAETSPAREPGENDDEDAGDAPTPEELASGKPAPRGKGR